MLWVIAIFAAWLAFVIGVWLFGQHAEEHKRARRQRYGMQIIDR